MRKDPVGVEINEEQMQLSDEVKENKENQAPNESDQPPTKKLKLIRRQRKSKRASRLLWYNNAAISGPLDDGWVDSSLNLLETTSLFDLTFNDLFALEPDLKP